MKIQNLIVNAGDFSSLTEDLLIQMHRSIDSFNCLTSRGVHINFFCGSLQCKLWSAGEANWTSTGCVSTQSALVSDNVTYVECNCTQLGYLSVFIGSATTKAPPTTAATEAPTQACDLEPRSKGINVTFTFNQSYGSVISNDSQEAAVRKSLRQVLSSALGMDECSVQDLRLKEGSIVVFFIVVPAKGQSTASVEAALSQLETKIKSGDLNVTLSGGIVLSADPSSFSSVPYTPSTVATTTTAAPTVAGTATESSGLSETNIIIIACVCGGVALIVIIAVAVYCFKKKRGEVKISPATTPVPQDDMEMNERGRFVSKPSRDHRGK